MKAHIGADVASGVVHTLTGTAANDADINQMAAVLHRREEAVFADAGYTGADQRLEHAAREVSWNIATKRNIIKVLPKGLRDCRGGSGRCRKCEAALPRPGQEHRATAYPVRAGQFGHRKGGPARPNSGLMTAASAASPCTARENPATPIFRRDRPNRRASGGTISDPGSLQWLYASMRDAGLPVELLETRHVRDAFKAMPVKTDRNDALGIASGDAARLVPPGALQIAASAGGTSAVDGAQAGAEHEP